MFPLPETLIGDVPTLVGTDGQAKMSKSLGNAIMLSDPPKWWSKRSAACTRTPRGCAPRTPGHVEGNPVFTYHDAFNDDTAEVEELKERYRPGRWVTWR